MLRVLACVCVLAGVANAEVTVGGLIGGLSLMQSADGNTVSMRNDSFKNGCSRTEIVVAPIGSVDGERVTVAVSGNCPDLQLAVDRAGEALAKRLTPRGFTELGAFGGYPANSPGEFELRFAERPTTLAATLALHGEVVGKADFPRGPGSISVWSYLLETPRQLVYIHVTTEQTDDAGKLIAKTSAWRVIAPSKPAPRQMRALAKRASEDPANTTKAVATLRPRRTCGTGSSVEWSGGYTLITCDGRMILLDKQNTVLVDEAAPALRFYFLHVFQASIGVIACGEVDSNASDRIICFDAANKRLLDHKTAGAASFDFFDAPPYVRVSEYVEGKPPTLTRLRWTGSGFK